MRKIRNLIWHVLFMLSIFFSLQLSAFSLSSEGDKFFVDRVIAVVNREVITWSELYKYMEFIAKDEVNKMNPDEKMKFFKRHENELLERLIDTKLQLEEAERYGVFVSDEEVDMAIKDIKTKYGLSDDAFAETIKKEGMSLSDYRKMIKEQIIIGRIINHQVKSKVIVNESDIKNYISSHPELGCDDEGYYISQIFIKKREKTEELKEKINEVVRKLLEGESFSKVASALSEDPSGKAGGYIGLLKKKEISKELDNIFSKMAHGQISEPLLTESGVYIFKLDGICFTKGSQQLTDYVRTLLADEKVKKEYKLWIRSLRQRAYIEIMD